MLVVVDHVVVGSRQAKPANGSENAELSVLTTTTSPTTTNNEAAEDCYSSRRSLFASLFYTVHLSALSRSADEV